MKLEQLNNLIGPDMKAVDAVIRTRLHSDVALVQQVAEYIINAGGKRLRPSLVLLAASACRTQKKPKSSWRKTRKVRRSFTPSVNTP